MEKGEITFINCFRLSLKAIVKDLQATQGKIVKKNLALRADVSMPYLNDIALARKAGSEDARNRIAEALGYNYRDFIEIGRMLHNGVSLTEAKLKITKQSSATVSYDDILKEIVFRWPQLNKTQHNTIFSLLKEELFRNWKHFNTIQEKGGDSVEVFRFIWETVCNESGLIVPFGSTTFELLKNSDIKNSDIYFEATNYVINTQASRKESDHAKLRSQI
jgi:hypothetical protein